MAEARPMPLPAPVTMAIFVLMVSLLGVRSSGADDGSAF
jgi:hypothetical protein